MDNGNQSTNVIWIVPKQDFCSKCGYAVYGRETRPGYVEAMGYYGGAPDGQITHMQCPGEPFFPPLAKRSDHAVDAFKYISTGADSEEE